MKLYRAKPSHRKCDSKGEKTHTRGASESAASLETNISVKTGNY